MIRQPWLAAFLSLLLPGIGQLYAGKRKQGIMVVLLCLCMFSTVIAGFWVFLISDNSETSRQFLALAIASGILLFLLSIYSCFDSYRAAKRHNISLNVRVMTEVKKPWLAVFLSKIFPGIGQFYNRQIVKGGPVHLHSRSHHSPVESHSLSFIVIRNPSLLLCLKGRLRISDKEERCR